MTMQNIENIVHQITGNNSYYQKFQLFVVSIIHLYTIFGNTLIWHKHTIEIETKRLHYKYDKRTYVVCSKS